MRGRENHFSSILVNHPNLGSVTWKWNCESISDYEGQANVISFYETYLQGVHECPLSLFVIVIIKIFVKLPNFITVK